MNRRGSNATGKEEGDFMIFSDSTWRQLKFEKYGGGVFDNSNRAMDTGQTTIKTSLPR